MHLLGMKTNKYSCATTFPQIHDNGNCWSLHNKQPKSCPEIKNVCLDPAWDKDHILCLSFIFAVFVVKDLILHHSLMHCCWGILTCRTWINCCKWYQSLSPNKANTTLCIGMKCHSHKRSGLLPAIVHFLFEASALISSDNEIVRTSQFFLRMIPDEIRRQAREDTNILHLWKES